MNRALRLVLLSALACAVGCSVPTIAELEQYDHSQDRGYKCDGNHPCPRNQTCFGDTCVANAEVACQPNETAVCGSSVGECRPGTMSCVSGKFGACMGGVQPVEEDACDTHDVNCDGRLGVDSRLNEVQRPGVSPNAVAISENAALIVTLEGVEKDTTFNDIGIYKLDATTVLGEVNHIGLDKGLKVLPPAIVAEHTSTSPTAIIGWISIPPGDKPRLTLVRLNEDGGRVGDSFSAPYGSDNRNVTGLALARDGQRVLALISVGASADIPDPQLLAVTISLDFSNKNTSARFSTPYSLGSPMTNFGVDATANGRGTGFLVAYESKGTIFSAVLDDTTGAPTATFSPPDAQAQDNVSPVIVPTASYGDHTLYFVRNPASGGSAIVSSSCTTPLTAPPTSPPTSGATLGATTGSCSAQGAIFLSTNPLQRARVIPPMGGGAPTRALISFRDTRAIAVAAVGTRTSAYSTPVVNLTTSGELPVVLNGAPYVVYQQPAATSSAGEMFVETHALRICL